MKKKLSDILCTLGYLMIGLFVICLLKSDAKGMLVSFILAITCVVGMCISLCRQAKEEP